MIRSGVFAGAFVMALAAIWAVSVVLSAMIGRDLAETAHELVAEFGIAHPVIEVDGLYLTVSGRVLDGEQAAVVRAALSERLPGVALIDRLSLEAVQAPFAAGALEIQHDETGVRVLADRLSADLEERIRSLAGTSPVRVFARFEEGPVRGLPEGADALIEAALALPVSALVFSSGAVEMRGRVPSDIDARGLKAALEAAAEEAGLTLSLALDVAPPIAVPYRFAAFRRGGSPVSISACALPDAEARERVAAVAPGAGALCRIASGAPDADWSGAVLAVLDALSALPDASAEIVYRAVRVVAGPAEDGAAVLERLKQALPEGFTLLPPPDAIAAATAPLPSAPPEPDETLWWFTAETGAGGVRLSGALGAASERALVAASAAAAFGGGMVTDGIGQAGGGASPDMLRAATVALAALGEAQDGRAELAGGRLRLIAAVPDQPTARAVFEQLRSVPESVPVETRITVDLPSAVAAIPMPAPRCAAMLNALVAANPMRFEPGSAALTEGDVAVIDRLAGVFDDCAQDRIMVEGHTDSQGSENYNLRLSQARAEAVEEALIVRGVLPTRLVAAGFGEDRPVADNGTEEGRMKNRRIAFSAGEDAP